MIFIVSFNTFSSDMGYFFNLSELFKLLIMEYLSIISNNSESILINEDFQYVSLSNMQAKEVIEINNSGHIIMPPDLKRSNKKTYNEYNNHNSNKRKLIELIVS